MLNPRVAARYAKSLMDIATEQNQMEAVQADMKYLLSVCRQSKEFNLLLKSPVIEHSKKLGIINAIAGNQITPLTAMFIKLLHTKNREGNLEEIAAAFDDRYHDVKGIHRVKLITATPIGEALQNELIGKLKAEKNMLSVEVEPVVDPAIIGGYKAEFDGILIDKSISKELAEVKKHFLNNDYLHKLR